MSLPTGYNGKALSPTVVIDDRDDVEQFRYESKSIDNPPTQDFRLTSLGIHAGLNDDHGSAILILEDHDNNMTTNDVKRMCKINRQWNVKINLGKGVTGDRWFYGKVLRADIVTFLCKR